MNEKKASQEVDITGDGNVVGDGSSTQVIKLEGGSTIIGDVIQYVDVEPPPRIPWPKVKRLCAQISAPRLEVVAENFGADLYVHREAVQKHVDRFLRAEDKNYFALVGKSGMGKSALLWGVANRLQGHPDVACLFCDASTLLESQQSAINVLLQHVAKASGIPPEEVLRAIDPGEKQSERRLVFIVDAINEFHHMSAMEQMLRDFHSCAEVYPWVRIVMSCRPHFWARIEAQRDVLGIARRYFYRAEGSDELFVRLDQPTDEEMEKLYSKYRRKYRFEPANMAELEEPLQRRLREPLMLWLVSEVCAGQSISGRKNLLLVDVEVIPEYVKQLRERGDLFKDSSNEQRSDERFLKETLPELFVRDGVCTNFVPRECVLESPDRAYTEEVLRRLIRSGILKEDGARNLSFSFERFFGYYLGLYLRDIAKKGAPPDCN